MGQNSFTHLRANIIPWFVYNYFIILKSKDLLCFILTRKQMRVNLLRCESYPCILIAIIAPIIPVIIVPTVHSGRLSIILSRNFSNVPL